VLFFGSIFIIAMSLFLSPSDGPLHLFGWEVPPLCTFKRLTGMDCPGCGLTRSFTWMGHGEVLAAFRMHKLGPALWVLVLAQIPLRAWQLWGPGRAAPGPAGEAGASSGPGLP
jgi:hypothetical protein